MKHDTVISRKWDTALEIFLLSKGTYFQNYKLFYSNVIKWEIDGQSLTGITGFGVLDLKFSFVEYFI